MQKGIKRLRAWVLRKKRSLDVLLTAWYRGKAGLKISYIAELNTLSLKGDSELIRDAIRPVELWDETYEPSFDWRTVFFDIVDIGDGDMLRAVSPPLLNFLHDISVAGVALDSLPEDVFMTHRFQRQQFSRFDRGLLDAGALVFTDQVDGDTFRVSPSRQAWKDFAGKNVLFTLQKDEPIQRIKEWMHFYNVIQGCDALLLYDNNSTSYSPETLLGELSGVPGYDVVVVVPWNFPYGVLGPPWTGENVKNDSAFAQVGAMEHARLRFLARANGMLNMDIDEYLVPLSGKTVFEALHDSAEGAIALEGHRIANVRCVDTGDILPHVWEFCLRYPGPCECYKWAMIPSRVSYNTIRVREHWLFNDRKRKTKLIEGYSKDFVYGHLRGLSSEWKDSKRHAPVDPKGMIVDLPVLDAMNRAFPDAYPKELLDRLRARASAEAEAELDAQGADAHI